MDASRAARSALPRSDPHLLDGSHLRKEIEGAYGFRMTETYFLSADGSRMFVVVRVGLQKKDSPIVGFDRVYDRIEGGGGTPKRGA